MLRMALSRSRDLQRLGTTTPLGNGSRLFSSSSSAASAESSSVAAMIKSVNRSPAFSPDALSGLKSKLQPFYPPPASDALSLQAKIALLGVTGWFLYKADKQARSHEWIVDLSLNVLQSAWLISFTSIIPFRSVFLAFRSLAPHTSAPLNAFRSAIAIKP